MKKQDSKNLEIIFSGDLHEIDIDLLINSLLNYSRVSQEVVSSIYPDSKINIKIHAPKEGSFILYLDLISQITNAVKTLFNSENISIVEGIISIVAGLYGFKKWIAKNGKPEKIKQKDNNLVEISNNNGKIIIEQKIYNIYNENPNIRNALRKTFSNFNEDDEIEKFIIRDPATKQDLFFVDKNDFVLMASDIDEIEQRKRKEIKENQELYVFKVIFKENYKWDFFLEGNKIKAIIEDKEFFKRIKMGAVAFRNGDKLIADIEIEQVFNESANTFVNESYVILKVLEHIPRKEQQSLDF